MRTSFFFQSGTSLSLHSSFSAALPNAADDDAMSAALGSPAPGGQPPRHAAHAQAKACKSTKVGLRTPPMQPL